jgi:uncharacterized protein (DUF2236 family)
MAHHLVLPALTVDERERYWAESRLFGALFGLTPADQPADWASFVVYNEAMVQSDILSVSTAARDVAWQIFSGGMEDARAGTKPRLSHRDLRRRPRDLVPERQSRRSLAATAQGYGRRDGTRL